MLKVTGARAWATVTGPLTAGMVGLPVTMEFDEAWEGLTKNLVCRSSEWGRDDGECRTILNVGTAAAVAHEVMLAERFLYLGVEGRSLDGKLVMPTTWALCGSIRPGANSGADLSADPTLPVWEQLRAEMEQLKEQTIPEGQLAELQALTQSAAQSATNAEGSVERAEQYAAVAGQAANAVAVAVDEADRAAQSAAASADRAEAAAESVGDREEIVRQVLAALPVWTGGDY